MRQRLARKHKDSVEAISPTGRTPSMISWRRAPLETMSVLLLIGPALAFVGLVILYPAVGSAVTSLKRDGDFVGFENYQAIFQDEVFWGAFKNNLILLGSIPIRIGIGIVITAVLYRGVFGGKIYELLIFLPFIPSIAAIGIIFIYILNFSGPLNGLLQIIGLGFLSAGWLTEPGYTMWSIMGVVVWTRVGFTVLLFTARLMSVDRELFQAAFVDGASWARTFRYVALPQLRGTIEFVAVLSVIEAFSWSFAYVYVLNQGANNTSNYILEIYLYNQEFLAYLPGMAAAVAVFLMLVVGSLAAYRYRYAQGRTT